MFKKFIEGRLFRLLTDYIKRQDDLRRQKLKFLYQQAYAWYLDFIDLKDPDPNVIELPFTKERLARYNAILALARVVNEGRVDQCYTKRRNELKKAELLA